MSSYDIVTGTGNILDAFVRLDTVAQSLSTDNFERFNLETTGNGAFGGVGKFQVEGEGGWFF